MKLKIWAARSNSECESWAVQEPSGKITVVKDLTVTAGVIFAKQELAETPRAWAIAEGRLRVFGNGSAVIE